MTSSSGYKVTSDKTRETKTPREEELEWLLGQHSKESKRYIQKNYKGGKDRADSPALECGHDIKPIIYSKRTLR